MIENQESLDLNEIIGINTPRIRYLGNSVRIELRGRFTLFDSNESRKTLDTIQCQVGHEYIMDFRQLKVIDSFGIGLIFKFGLSCQKKGAQFYVCNIPQDMRQIFAAIGLLKIFQVLG